MRRSKLRSHRGCFLLVVVLCRMITTGASLQCFVGGFASAIVTGGLDPVRLELGCSTEVINLSGESNYLRILLFIILLMLVASVTMFVVGFGLGPLLFAPLSESKPYHRGHRRTTLIFYFDSLRTSNYLPHQYGTVYHIHRELGSSTIREQKANCSLPSDPLRRHPQHSCPDCFPFPERNNGLCTNDQRCWINF